MVKNTCVQSMQKFAIYYCFNAEITKFGLISIHLKLFFGKMGEGEGQENIWGRNVPMPPYGATTV